MGETGGDMLRLPPSCAARYRADRLLGEGGCGVVYLATDLNLERPVALKLLHGAFLSQATLKERFLNEARITASLSHPAIVVILDHGIDEDVPWIVYEYLPGESLQKLIKRSGAMGWRDVLTSAAPLASALKEAHGQGILHRDIKPANILQVEPGRFKLTDFGVAKWSGSQAVHTQTGQILGTPAYLAPEVLGVDGPSPASDIYAFGLVLYEMLTGKFPFQAHSLAEFVTHHHRTVPPPPSSLVSGIPPVVDRIVSRALEKRKEDRQPSAAALHAEMVEALSRPRASRRLSRPVLLSSASVSPAASWSVGDPAGRSSRGVMLLVGILVTGLALLFLSFGPTPSKNGVPAPSSRPIDSPRHRPTPAHGPISLASGELEELSRGVASVEAGNARTGAKYARMHQRMGWSQNPDEFDLTATNRIAGETIKDEDGSIEALDRMRDRVLRRSPSVADLAWEPAFLLARIYSLRFRAWERRQHSLHVRQVIARLEAAGEDSMAHLDILGMRMDAAHCPGDGIADLIRFVETSAVAFGRMAETGEAGDAPMTALLSDVRHEGRTLYMIRWLAEAERRLPVVVERRRATLARLSGPAGSTLGRLVNGLWDFSDVKRPRGRDRVLLEALLEDLVRLRVLLPRSKGSFAAIEQEVVKELSRLTLRPGR